MLKVIAILYPCLTCATIMGNSNTDIILKDYSVNSGILAILTSALFVNKMLNSIQVKQRYQ